MRLLTLVRHAKSSWDDPRLADFERPLNARGQRDAPRMAVHLRRALGVPERIVTSPAVRALTTARLFAEALDIPEAELIVQRRIYEASADTLLGLAQQLDDADRHVMLCGHNPGLSELAHLLARCSFDDLPTCGAVQIGFAAVRWGDVKPRTGVQRFYACPKQLKQQT